MPTGEKIRAHAKEHRARNVRIVWAACRLRLRFVPTYANSREIVKDCHCLVKDRNCTSSGENVIPSPRTQSGKTALTWGVAGTLPMPFTYSHQDA